MHDAYIELANLLLKNDPLSAVEVYSRLPLKPVCEQTYDDAFITGEIVHILMKHEMYEHPRLAQNLIAHGKVMGLGEFWKNSVVVCCLDKASMLLLLTYWSEPFQNSKNKMEVST